MRRLATLLAATALLAAPAAAQGISNEDFKAETAGALARLCAASEDTPTGKYAIGFCYGWIAGVEQFYDALVADKRFDIKPTICPDGEISRTEAKDIFEAWMKANPAAENLKTLDAMIQALRAKYPC